MLVYLDKDFKCHVTDDGTMTAYETNFFDGKCPQFIEGYRLVPRGEAWVREDGKAFEGLYIEAWADYPTLLSIQAEYDAAELADARAALELLGVSTDG